LKQFLQLFVFNKTTFAGKYQSILWKTLFCAEEKKWGFFFREVEKSFVPLGIDQ